MRSSILLAAGSVFFAAGIAGGADAEKKATATPYAAWKHGPPADASYFPIAVWLQDPRNAPKYKEAGFNLYVGLWQGPTEAQLEALRKADMPVICDQNEVGLAHASDPIIVGWMHGDEPDNAQSLGEGKGYGPPIPPARIIADFERMRTRDATRPVMLNLGQGVAWDGWYGRGVRTNHPEDYLEYVKGGDIISFDIYPAVHDKPDVAGKLWYVPRGVDRLREWSRDQKIIWNCIESTRIGNVAVKPTPRQVRAEVWMSIIHGSRGLIYFVHQFQPNFIEAGLFADPEMLSAVTAINKQIRELAPVLNSPTVKNIVTVKSSDEKVPIDCMLKCSGRTAYIFAACMRDAPATATFEVKWLPAKAEAAVIGENRTIAAEGGTFQDSFGPYDVRIYRVR
jgi:hypothetical protein